MTQTLITKNCHVKYSTQKNIQFVFFILLSSVFVCICVSFNFIEKKFGFLALEKIFGCCCSVFFFLFVSFIYSSKGEQSDHLNLVATEQMYMCWNMYVQNDKWHRLKGNECTFRKDDQHWTRSRIKKIKTIQATWNEWARVRQEWKKGRIKFRVKILLKKGDA